MVTHALSINGHGGAASGSGGTTGNVRNVAARDHAHEVGRHRRVDETHMECTDRTAHPKRAVWLAHVGRPASSRPATGAGPSHLHRQHRRSHAHDRAIPTT